MYLFEIVPQHMLFTGTKMELDQLDLKDHI